MMRIEKICTDLIFLLKNLATNSLINLYKLVNSWLKFYLNIYVRTTGFIRDFLFFYDSGANSTSNPSMASVI